MYTTVSFTNKHMSIQIYQFKFINLYCTFGNYDIYL